MTTTTTTTTTRDAINTEDHAPYDVQRITAATGEDRESEILQAAAAILRRRMMDREKSAVLTSPDTTRRYLRYWQGTLEHEVFAVIFLDTRHRVISIDEMFTGTIDAAHVHPREVVKAALRHNAAAVIVAHNHPSGNAEPSQADLAITRRLRDALGLVDIRLLDHFIAADREVVSLAERGLV